MTNMEMANAGDTEGLVKAAQKSILTCMQEVVASMKKDMKAPGLTWEQIDFMIEHLKTKQATIIFQEHEV